MIIAINKWDLLEKDNNTVKEFTEKVKIQMPFINYVPVITMSALTGKRTVEVLKLVKSLNEEYNKKIGTGVLNQVLSDIIAQNPVPTRKGRTVKINYMTQISTAPPKFVFFVNNPELVHFSYKRYIEKKLREYFGFEGCPIEMIFNKKSENVYK